MEKVIEDLLKDLEKEIKEYRKKYGEIPIKLWRYVEKLLSE